MKNRICRMGLVMIGMVLSGCLVPESRAENSPVPAPAGDAAEKAASSQKPAPKISSGVAEILQLARGRVGDDTLIAFVSNSGRGYNLSAAEILYLREEGVSERVLTAMLEQRNKVTEAPATPVESKTPDDPALPPPVYANPGIAAAPPQASQSSATYIQTAPGYVPSSTVNVVPSSSPTLSYYGYYPYYGGYYGFGYPGWSLSFGFGSYYGGSCHRGGYYVGSGRYGGHYGGGGHGGHGHSSGRRR